MKTTVTPPRLSVAKAYKMFIGGAFVRGDSGRTVTVAGAAVPGSGDGPVVNVPVGSRKDVRDAVVAARGAFTPWARRAAHDRGLVLYRFAEMLESRGPELAVALERAGEPRESAAREVAAAVDRVVFYAGFCDKIAALLGSSNPVAGPYLGLSVVEPVGVVGIALAPRPALLGLVSLLLPVLASGNTAIVVVPAAEDPRVAALVSEVVATSDVPAGVVNVLFGDAGALGAELAKHRDVNAVLAVSDRADLRAALEREGAGSVKRVVVRAPLEGDGLFDPRVGQGLGYIEPFVETKSIWHPVGI